jgi:hypothetical protein
MARPQVRRRRLPTPAGRCMATRSQLLHPPMGRTTLSLRKATPVGRCTHRHRTLLAPQTLVSRATYHGHRDHPLPRLARHVLPRTTRLARGGRTTRMERRGFLTATPAGLHTRRGVILRTLRTPSPSIADLRSITCHPPVHPLQAPQAARNRPRRNHVGTTALDMLSNSLAPTSYANYDNGMRQFAAC